MFNHYIIASLSKISEIRRRCAGGLMINERCMLFLNVIQSGVGFVVEKIWLIWLFTN